MSVSFENLTHFRGQDINVHALVVLSHSMPLDSHITSTNEILQYPPLGARRPINSHLPRHPQTHPLPLHQTSTCLSSVASSPRKSVRNVAQLAEAQWKSRNTANGRSNAAKPMWPFYVSGMSRTPKSNCERGGNHRKDELDELRSGRGVVAVAGQR